MLNDATCFKQVYIVCGYTDLRSGIDTLASIVDAKTDNSPYVPDTLYLFCGRKSDRIKGLVWEKDGFLLLYKRLEQGKFVWPRNESEVQAITGQQFRWLMEGLTITPKKTVQEVDPPTHSLTWHDDCAIRRIFNGDFALENSVAFIICKAIILHCKRITSVL